MHHGIVITAKWCILLHVTEAVYDNVWCERVCVWDYCTFTLFYYQA